MDEMTKNRQYMLTEHGTDKYADLQMAQAALVGPLAQALVACIRARVGKAE